MKRNWFYGVALMAILSLGFVGCDGGSSGGGGSIGKQGVSGGFLWKPRSESNGKLVVLLPNYYRGRVSSCHIANKNGGVIEQGVFTTDTHNGNRPHFRFTKSGAEYGNDIYTVADTDEGTVHWYIPAGAARTEY